MEYWFIRKRNPARLDQWIAWLLSELRTNAFITESIYMHLEKNNYEDSWKNSFLRFTANTAFNSSIILITTLLTKESKKKKDAQFSFCYLPVDKTLLKKIQDFWNWKESIYRNIRNNTSAHKNITHPEPAWALSCFLDIQAAQDITKMAKLCTEFFESQCKWNTATWSENEICSFIESFIDT